MRWLWLALSLLAASACGQSETPAVETERGRVHSVRGEVKAIDGERIDVDHEEIPGVMPAMQMPFYATDGAIFQLVSVGDRVEFEFEMIDGRHIIHSIRKID